MNAMLWAVAIAGGCAAAYLVVLWILIEGHRGHRLVAWGLVVPVRLVRAPVLALRSMLRPEQAEAGTRVPLAGRVDLRANGVVEGVALCPPVPVVDHRASADYPDDINLSPEKLAELREWLVDRYGEEQVRELGFNPPNSWMFGEH